MIEFQCQHCGSLLNIGSDEAGRECNCAICGALTLVPFPNHHPTPARGGLTVSERLVNALKLFGGIFGISFVMMFLFEPLSMILFIAVVFCLVIYVPTYIITTLGSDFLYRHDEQYHEYRKSGGHPFFDNLLPWGDGIKDYQLPYEEPSYEGFVPPRSWGFQCLTCYARIEAIRGQCWNCGVQMSSGEKRFPMD